MEEVMILAIKVPAPLLFGVGVFVVSAGIGYGIVLGYILPFGTRITSPGVRRVFEGIVLLLALAVLLLSVYLAVDTAAAVRDSGYPYWPY